jgi:hypothetical protein
VLAIPPYTVIDMSDKDQRWAVVCEAKERSTCEDYIRVKQLGQCDVFKESGEELYRGLCKTSRAESNSNDLSQ